jgi:hypothetical protein
MKAVGIGAPRTLVLRLKSCEIGVWCDALRDACAASQPRDDEADARGDELTRLLREAQAPRRDDRPFEVTGATRTLAPLVHRATALAIERYVTAARPFVAQAAAHSSADQLRAAVDAAGA